MIFVTGATGFLGSNLCSLLIEKGYKIRASRRDNSIIPSALKDLEHLIEWVNIDLLDVFEVEEAIQDCDAIFHCAAQVSFNPKDKKQLWKSNVAVTHNLVNAALRFDKIHFIHVSSIAAVGEAKTGKQIDESNRWVYRKKDSDYAVTKFEAEREVWRGMLEGLKAVIVNPSVILGYDERSLGSMTFVNQIKKGLKFYTEGVTGFVDVKDVASVMIMLFEKGISDERYIVSSENKSYKDIFKTISSLLNKKPPFMKAATWLLLLAARLISWFPFISRSSKNFSVYTARSANKKSYYSNKKISTLLDYHFIPVNESLKQMVLSE